MHDKDDPLLMFSDLRFPTERAITKHSCAGRRKASGLWPVGVRCISYSKDREINNLALIAC